MNDMSQRVFTFLFTDMEDSTRLWADFADQMPDVLERNDSFSWLPSPPRVAP